MLVCSLNRTIALYSTRRAAELILLKEWHGGRLDKRDGFLKIVNFICNAVSDKECQGVAK